MIKRPSWILSLMAVLILIPALVQANPYFSTLLQDPMHPKVSASFLYTPSFVPDGGVTNVALVYHKADPDNTLWPQSFLDAGFKPLSWTLLEVGIGGNRETAFFHGGLSVNIGPTLLGPLTQKLAEAGGKYATFGSFLVSPDGSGVKIGLGWKTNIIRNGGLANIKDMRFPPRYSFGYVYVFGK